MQKQAPSIGRIMIAVGFALSCFGLLLFLWIEFGGPSPLKSQGYRFTTFIPEAAQVKGEEDVRIGGVSVGRVKSVGIAPLDKRVNGKDTAELEIEIEPQFAPISRDARATLRMKTLLGETFIELTRGTDPDTDASGDPDLPVSLGAAGGASDADLNGIEALPEGGELGVGQTKEQVQIDEIFNAFDEEARTSFQRWMTNAAIAIEGRKLDFNEAFGNIGPFIGDLTEVVEILNQQDEALQGLVRDTGIVFEALTERNQELAGAVVGSRNTFEALASEEEALAEIFRIFPTFQRESRATFERLDAFQANTRPLLRDMIPVARELTPTLASLRRLAPALLEFFPKLEELEHASEDGLPALREFLDGLRPVLRALDPFLANLNPVIRYLEFQKPTVADFLVGPGSALARSIKPLAGDPAPRHYLRQLSYSSSESLSIHANRLATNRGNAYKSPRAINNRASQLGGIFTQFDCKNTNFTPTSQPEDEVVVTRQEADPMFAPCHFEGPFPSSRFGDFGDGRFPNLFRDR